jgi:hypothetical protein
MYITCACSNCSGHIEFDASGVGDTVACPHCGLETALFDPHKPQSSATADVTHLDLLAPSGEPLLQLPEITDESFRNVRVRSSDGQNFYMVNLIDYTCTCPSFLADHSNAPQRSFGRMCKHICRSLNDRKILPLLNPLCRAMVEEGYGILSGRFDLDKNGNTIYISGVNAQGWLNVFSLKRKDGKKFYRFGYNIIEGRWAYGQGPKINEEILRARPDFKYLTERSSARFVADSRRDDGGLRRVMSKTGRTFIYIISAVIIGILAYLVLTFFFKMWFA